MSIAVEIGCGGFPVQSTLRAMHDSTRMKAQDYRDCRQQLRTDHHAGCGGEEQCRAGSHIQKGND